MRQSDRITKQRNLMTFSPDSLTESVFVIAVYTQASSLLLSQHSSYESTLHVPYNQATKEEVSFVIMPLNYTVMKYRTGDVVHRCRICKQQYCREYRLLRRCGHIVCIFCHRGDKNAPPCCRRRHYCAVM